MQTAVTDCVKRGKFVARFMLAALKEWVADRCDSLAGALAFFGSLSSPLFLAVLLWASMLILGAPLARRSVFPVLLSWLGPERAEGLRAMLSFSEGLAVEDLATMRVASALVLLFGTLGFFLMVQNALEDVWNVRREQPGFIVQMKKRLFGLVVAAVSGLLVLCGLLLAGLLFWVFEGWASQGILVQILRDAMLATVGFLVIWAVVSLWLRTLIPVRLTLRRIAPWSAMISGLHLLGWRILLWHFSDSHELNTAVAAISSMLWLYYASLVFLYGAEVMRLYLVRYGKVAMPGAKDPG